MTMATPVPTPEQGDITLDFLAEGDPDGRPILLLHGYTDSCRSFKTVLEAMPTQFRTLAPSLRGHGDSSRPSHGYRTRDFAEDVATFVRAVESRPVVVVGHSMGSAIALRLAIDHPDLVCGLVLVGAFATFSGNEGFVELYREGISELEDPVDERFVRDFQMSTLANPIDPGFMRSIVHESLKLPADVWKQAARGMLEDDFSQELDRVEARTRILWGDADVFSPRSDQARLVRSIAKADLSVHPGAGHALHWERPQALVAELQEFLTSPRPA